MRLKISNLKCNPMKVSVSLTGKESQGPLATISIFLLLCSNMNS